MEEKLAAVRDLIAQRDEVDRQLSILFGETFAPRQHKPKNCRKCGKVGHTARTCQEIPTPATDQ